MRKDKRLAQRLREQGKSYKSIRDELGIPLSTLSDWFSKIEWSSDLKKRLIQEASKIIGKKTAARWEAWRETFRVQARRDFHKHFANPLFVAGICLYWGEGDNQPKNGLVRLVNTDPRMITLFCKFLREAVKVNEEKIKVSLVLYRDLSDRKCKHFWGNITNVPLTRFHKTQFIHGTHPTRRTAYGMCTVYVSSRELKEKIFTWTELLYKQYLAAY